MSVFSLAEFAAKLVASDGSLKAAEHDVIAKGCAMVAERAKDMIGVPQPGWATLAPETLKRKDGVNTPLLETGELRDSITWNADAHEGYVGSNDKKAIFQELGTSRMPPRSFLGAAAVQMESDIDKMADRAVAAAFEGTGVFGEVLRGLKETGHKLKETAEGFNEMLQGGDDDNR
jgi:HK97 gp10 family phage protein